MDLTVVASASAAIVAVAAFVVIAVRPTATNRWQTPGALLVVFTGWTIYSIVDGGPFGFLPQHVGAAWESQITMDLLILGGAAWFALQPRLRAAGINPLPWLPLILATGSIGMLLMIVRLFRIEATASRAGSDRHHHLVSE